MIELQVEGMSCGHCASRVTQSVGAVDAEARVEVDLATGTVKVQSDAVPERIAAAIADAGYAVTRYART